MSSRQWSPPYCHHGFCDVWKRVCKTWHINSTQFQVHVEKFLDQFLFSEVSLWQGLTRRRRGKNVFARLVMHKNNNKLCGSSHASLEVHFRVLISRTSIPFLPTAILFYFQKKTLHLNFYWAHGSHSSVTHKHNLPLIN